MTDYSKCSEQELVSYLNTGDYRAFTEIYDRYKIKLAANLLRMLKSPELTEEVLQDLFMALWEQRDRVDPDKPIAAYLFRIAVNKAKNIYRKAAHDRQMKAYIFAQFEEGHNSVEQYINEATFRQALTDLLEQLPPKQREVYTLCKLEGKSYKEVSHLLNISETTVNSHIRNANLFLRAQISTMPDWLNLLIAALIVKGL